MASYSDLRTKFLDRIKRRDCTTALADGFISDAIKRAQRVLRIPAMEQSLTVTLDATNYGTDGVLYIPADYVKLREITVNDEFSLVRKPLDYVLALADAQVGTPTCFARRGDGFIFAPAPSLDDYEIRIDYYAEFAEFDSTDDDDMILADVAEDLIVYGALSYACDHWIDKRGPLFEQRFIQILSDLQDQADQDELSEAAVGLGFTYASDD